MRFTIVTIPEKQRLTQVFNGEEVLVYQELIRLLNTLAHKPGFKRDIPSPQVAMIEDMYSRFDWEQEKPKVTNHVSTQIEVEDE